MFGRKQNAVEEAAREALAHGGPECRTDPHKVTDAMGRALDEGATYDDIAAEMRRQREN